MKMADKKNNIKKTTIQDEQTPQLSVEELQKQILKIDSHLKKIKFRIKQYTVQLESNTTVSVKEKSLVEKGILLLKGKIGGY